MDSEPLIHEEDIETTHLGWQSTIVVAVACLGGLLFGYQTNVISGVLPHLSSFSLSNLELVTSVTSLGCLFGSLASGFLADKYSRKTVLLWCAVVFIVSTLAMTFSTGVVTLTVGRIVVGLGVGASASVVPLYITEVSPSRLRTKLLTLNSVCITGGQLLAYIVCILCKTRWRLMFAWGLVPAVLLLVSLRFIPESPRLLIMQKNFDEATRSFKVLYPNATDTQVQNKITAVCNSTMNSSMPKDLPSIISSVKKMRSPLILGCMLMFFQQIVGFNAIMYYSTLIFKEMVDNPLLLSILFALTNFMFTLACMILIDKFGRKNLLWSTSLAMALALCVASWCFKLMETHNMITLLLISIVLYVACYAAALGTIPWHSVEFLPTESRSLGSGIITCVNWTTNFAISVSFLSLNEHFGAWRTLLGYAVMCVMCFWYVVAKYPNVQGMDLEQVANLFSEE